jgi:hypothetical protein
VLDREKPAHTTYTLCTIGPRMRVGATARVGVDAIVAGPPPPTALGAPGDGRGALTLAVESGRHAAVGAARVGAGRS